MLGVVAGQEEAACTFFEVGEGVAHGSVGEDDVILARVLVAQVHVFLLIEESPLVAHLLGSPDEAVGLLVEGAPIDVLVAPVDGVVGLSGGHGLGLARRIAGKLGAVADDVELVAFLNLSHIGNPGKEVDAAQLAHLSIGEGRFPECYLGDIGIHLLAVFIGKEIEGGVELPARLGGGILEDFLAVDIDLEGAFAVGEHHAIPHIAPHAAEVAAHGASADLALADEEVAVVGIGQVRLQQAVVGVCVRHFQVNHKGEGGGGGSSFAAIHLQGRSGGHEDGGAASRRAVGRCNASIADCAGRDAVVAYHGGRQQQTTLGSG